MKCPLYRTLHRSIEFAISYELVSTGEAGKST
jgi:hypothetical protein